MSSKRSPNPWHPSYPDVWKVLDLRETDSNTNIQSRIGELETLLNNKPYFEERETKLKAIKKIAEAMKTPVGRSLFRNTVDFEDSARGLTEKWNLFYDSQEKAKTQVNIINALFKEKTALQNEVAMLKRQQPQHPENFYYSLTYENLELNNEVEALRKQLHDKKNDCEHNHTQAPIQVEQDIEYLELNNKVDAMVPISLTKVADINAQKTGASSNKQEIASKPKLPNKKLDSPAKQKMLVSDSRTAQQKKEAVDRPARTKQQQYKPFKCVICHHRFRLRFARYRHMRVVHPCTPELIQKLQMEAAEKFFSKLFFHQ